MSFITESHILKKIWIFFNLAFEPLAHLNTFCHVILCESLFDLDSVWVQLKVILQDPVNGWTRKIQLLRASRSDFFGLHPTGSPTASTFYGDLVVKFLPLVDFCPFFVDFINVPVSLNFFTQQVIWNLWDIYWNWTFCSISPGQSSMISSPDGGSHKMFFFFWQYHLLDQMKCYSIFYQPWKTQNNIINIGRVINLQMGHVYNETLYRCGFFLNGFPLFFNLFLLLFHVTPCLVMTV